MKINQYCFFELIMASPQLFNNKLIHDGFIYTRDRVRGDTSYWKCKKRKICGGRAKCTSHDGTFEITITKDHSHFADNAEKEILRAKYNLKKKALEYPEAHTAALVRVELKELSSSAMTSLPGWDSLCRTVNRSRSNKRSDTGRTHLDTVVAPLYSMTISGQPFVMYTSGSSSREKITIFATDSNIQHLYNCEIWYIDGSYESNKGPNCNLWTLCGVYDDIVLPLVYVLADAKNIVTYKLAIEKVKLKAEELNMTNFDELPSLVLMDFDSDAIGACRSSFKSVQIHLCYFHFKKMLKKEMERNDILEFIQTPSEIGNWLREMMAIALIPPKDVVEAFEYLLSTIQNDDWTEGIISFTEYFDINFVRGCSIGLNDEVLPQYPVALWNVYERVVDDLMEIEFSLEDTWKKLNDMTSKEENSISKLLNGIRSEQQITENTLERIQKKLNSSDNRKVVLDYEKYTQESHFGDYLKTVAKLDIASL